MKKAKIFLSTIAVFAVVGGALAFKAKTYDQLFCTRAIEHNSGVCEVGMPGKIDVVNGHELYYTVTNNPDNCAQTQCETTTFLINE